MDMMLVPVICRHVVIVHVSQFVYIRYSQWFTRRIQSVYECGTIHVEVIPVRWVPLSGLVQGGISRPHVWRTSWIPPLWLYPVGTAIRAAVHRGYVVLVVRRQTLRVPLRCVLGFRLCARLR